MSSRLTNLPCEILLEISRYIRQAHDLDSWLMTSKFIRQLNATSITEHNIRTRRYKGVGIGSVPMRDLQLASVDANARHFLELRMSWLRSRLGDVGPIAHPWRYSEMAALLPRNIIYEEDAIASYIRQLVYSWDINMLTHWHDPARGESRYRPRLRQLLEQSPYIFQNEIDDWMGGAIDGPILAALLTLLPNLKALDLVIPETWTRYLAKPLHRVALDPTASTLTSLTTVQLNGDSRSQTTSLALVVAIALLPAIRDLTIFKLITDIDNFDAEKEILYRCSSRKSNVTRLIITGPSSFNPDLLSLFHALFYRLKVIEYSEHWEFGRRDTFKRQPFEFLDSLRHMSSSVRDLTFRIWQPNSVNNVFGPLQEFTQLKRLNVNLNILLPDVSRYKEMSVDVSQRLPDQKLVERTLAEMLPSSIEHLVLFCPDFMDECHIRATAELLKSREKGLLPNLRRVIFATGIDPNTGKKISPLLRTACARHEICVSYSYETCRGSHRNCGIHIDPQWHEEY